METTRTKTEDTPQTAQQPSLPPPTEQPADQLVKHHIFPQTTYQDTSDEDLMMKYRRLPKLTQLDLARDKLIALKEYEEVIHHHKESLSYLGYDTALAVPDGLITGLQEYVQAVASIGEWVNDHTIKSKFLDGVYNYTQSVSAPADMIETTTTPGKVVEGISQFLGGFGVAGKSIKGVAVLKNLPKTKAIIAGAMADFAAFDGHDANLSNLLKSIGEEAEEGSALALLHNDLTDWLAKEEDDSDLEGRIKNTLEGGILGIVTDKLFESFKAVRGYIKLKKQVKAELSARSRYQETPSLKMKVTLDSTLPEPKETSTIDPVGTFQEPSAPASIKVAPDKAQELTDALVRGDLESVASMTSFNEKYVDFSTIEDEAGVKTLLNTAQAQLVEVMKDAGALKTVSEDTIKRVAPLVGQSAEVIHALHKDVYSNQGLSARMLAAENVMYASANKVLNLAKSAKALGSGNNGSVLKELHRQIQLHGAIQAEVRGAKAEVARALRMMQAMRKANTDFSEFDTVLAGKNGKAVDHDALLDDLINSANTGELNDKVRSFTGKGFMDVLSEVTINGLLSGPKTHMVNMLSNGLNAGFGIATRWGAVATGTLRKNFYKGAVIEFDEALAYTRGTLDGITEGFQYAMQAFKDRAPVSDAIQRAEFTNRRAIHIDEDTIARWELSGNYGQEFLTKGFKVFGHTVSGATSINALGEVIRAPGTALLASDEFFKAIARRSQLAALAVREARAKASLIAQEGTPEFRETYDRVFKDAVENPTAEMKKDALLYARRQTFQEAPGKTAAALEHVLNAHPVIKLFMFPFVRTPLNLVRQAVIDNSPFGLLSSRLRQVIREGGPEGDLAIARITIGGTLMASAFGLWSSGDLVGSQGGYRNTERMDGVKPYSLRLPGTDIWVSFDRMDPFGMMLGMTADMAEAMTEDYDPTDPDSSEHLTRVAGGVLSAVSTNVLSNTWMQSAEEFLQAVNGTYGENDGRDFSKFLARRALMPVPFSSALRSTAKGETAKEVDPADIWEHFQNMVPGLSEALPVKRDMLGRVVTLTQSERSMFLPFYISEESSDPLDLWLSDKAFDFKMPSRRIDGVKLTSQQYSRMLELAHEMGLEDTVRDIVTDPGFSGLYEEIQAAEVRKVVTKFYYNAREQLLSEEPELQKVVLWARTRHQYLQAGVSPRELTGYHKEFLKQFED